MENGITHIDGYELYQDPVTGQISARGPDTDWCYYPLATVLENKDRWRAERAVIEDEHRRLEALWSFDDLLEALRVRNR